MINLVTSSFKYLFGFSKDWTDSRPAQISVGITRIAVFSAILWVNFIVLEAMNGSAVNFSIERANSVYHPFSLLLLFDGMPGPIFWQIAQLCAFVATPLAILGLATRPAMIISTIASLLLILLDASRYSMWSHPYNVIFLAAIPFMFSNAGQSLSLDAWIARKRSGWFFAPTKQPAFWAVLSVQYSAALFYFGALWAKLLVSKVGWDYIFTDNMRNILAVTWKGYVEVDTPFYIETIAQSPFLWMSMSFVHLVMQGLPLCVIFAVHRPNVRLFEGVLFAVSCIGLAMFMSVMDPWWLLLFVAFVDWDYYLPKLKATLQRKFCGTGSAVILARRLDTTPYKYPALLSAILILFFGTYCTAFLLQIGDKLKLYPFSNMDMYAAVYATKPYNERNPYVDVLRGNLTIQLPENGIDFMQKDARWIRIDNLQEDIQKKLLPKISRKLTRKDFVLYRLEDNRLTFSNIPDIFHLLAREKDTAKLKGGIEEFIAWVSPMPLFEDGTKFVLYQETQVFAPYPEKLGKTDEPYHKAVRAVYDVKTSKFASLSVSSNGNLLTIDDEDGINSYGKVMAHVFPDGLKNKPELVTVPGRWTNDKTFKIDDAFLEKHSKKNYLNFMIEGKTDGQGTYLFDGPIVFW